MLVRGLQTSFYLVMSDDDDNARFVSLQKRTSAFFQVQQLMLILRIHIKIQLFCTIVLTTSLQMMIKMGAMSFFFKVIRADLSIKLLRSSIQVYCNRKKNIISHTSLNFAKENISNFNKGCVIFT